LEELEARHSISYGVPRDLTKAIQWCSLSYRYDRRSLPYCSWVW
jgi:hypothetical protein